MALTPHQLNRHRAVPYIVKGPEFRLLRKQLAWTQAQAAREIGVASNTVARWEQDELAIGEPEAWLLRGSG